MGLPDDVETIAGQRGQITRITLDRPYRNLIVVRRCPIACQHLVGQVEDGHVRAQQAERRRLLAPARRQAEHPLAGQVADQPERIDPLAGCRRVQVEPRPGVLHARRRQGVPSLSGLSRQIIHSLTPYVFTHPTAAVSQRVNQGGATDLK